MNILQSIFTDYYEQIIYELHPRPTVIENINKITHCENPSHSGAMYGCPHCRNLKFLPFRYKSRFCLSYDNQYNQFRSFHISRKLVAYVHRHCVFTIPDKPRVYFLKNRALLDCLFHTVRDLKWNLHIYVPIFEGSASNITAWRPIKHFDYSFLRNAFQKLLLEKLANKVGPSFRKVKNEMYNKHSDGFNIRAKPNLCRPDITIKYISIYLGRPVIATSRID